MCCNHQLKKTYFHLLKFTSNLLKGFKRKPEIHQTSAREGTALCCFIAPVITDESVLQRERNLKPTRKKHLSIK